MRSRTPTKAPSRGAPIGLILPLVVTISSVFCQASPQEVEYRSLAGLLESGHKALQRRDFTQAAQNFNAIVENYQNEALWRSSPLPSKILPLAGLASHKAQMHAEAIVALKALLDSEQTDRDTALFARYLLACSLLEEGEEQAAELAYQELRSLAGKSAFKDLSLLREAQLGEAGKAAAALRELLKDPSSPRLASLGQLMLAEFEIEAGRHKEALELLADPRFGRIAFFDMARRSALAAQLAEASEAEAPLQALRSYRLVVPKAALLEQLKRELAEKIALYRDRSPTLSANQTPWTEHFLSIIAEIRAQIEQLESTPDYADAISLRKARCLARLDRPIEAWLLLEPIALSGGPIAKTAHMDWISIARDMEAWHASALIAREYLERYPNDKEAARALLMVALAQVDQQEFADAILSLYAAREAAQDAALQASCDYYSGYCHYQLASYSSAISSYRSTRKTLPDSMLSGQALLWIGMCHFANYELDQAQEAFGTAIATPSLAALHPEAAYRKAVCLFAEGQVEKTVASCESWLEEYSLSARAAEAHLLLGNAYEELGRADKAIAAYNKVETSDPQLLHQARLQSAEIRLRQSEPGKALEILNAFEENAPILPQFATAHHLLAAKALERSAGLEPARKRLEEAIASFGDLLETVDAIELLEARYASDEPGLRMQMASIDPASRSVLAARFATMLVRLARGAGKHSEAKISALSLVSDFPKETLSPQALLEAGAALLEIESLEAAAYFEQVLAAFPRSSSTDAARLGLARHSRLQGDPALALAHLGRIELADESSQLLRLELLAQLDKDAQAEDLAQEILSDRLQPASSKASALTILGEIKLAEKRPLEAYACFQRIFTLYRAEAEKAAQAYLRCAEILANESRSSDALSVLEEMLAQEDLRASEYYLAGQELSTRLSASQASATQ